MLSLKLRAHIIKKLKDLHEVAITCDTTSVQAAPIMIEKVSLKFIFKETLSKWNKHRGKINSPAAEVGE